MTTNHKRRRAAGGSAPVASIVFTASASDIVNGTNYSFASQSIGTASADRLILVAITGRRTAIADPSSVTVGGIAATKLVSSIGTGGLTYSGIYVAAVPTGTAATVEVIWVANSAQCGIAVAAAYGVQSATPVDTEAVNNANPHILSLSAVAGSVAFGTATVQATTTWTWTGLTEGCDFMIESLLAFTAATGDIAAAGTAAISAESGITDAGDRAACSVCLA